MFCFAHRIFLIESAIFIFFQFQKRKPHIFFYCRYAFEGIMQATYGFNRTNLDCSEIYCHFHSPNTILSMMNMPTVSFHVILIILGCWIFCLHVITYAVLSWKIHYARKWLIRLISINMYLHTCLCISKLIN